MEPSDHDTSSHHEQDICECGDPLCPGNVSFPWPFKVNASYVGPNANDLSGYFSLRTTSWEWDGERTDLHDLLSILWALSLRARDVASVHLIAELNPATGIDSEIYARILLPRQEGTIANLVGRPYLKALSVEAYAANELITEMFGVPASGPSEIRDSGADYQNPPGWVAAARQRLRLPSSSGWEFNHRKALDTKVFTSLKRGITIAELGERPMMTLHDRLASFQPAVANVGDVCAIRSPHLLNAVGNKQISRANSFLRMMEGGTPDPTIIPLDSHVVFLGNQFLVSIAAECGAAAFEAARVATERRRLAEAEVFLTDAEVCWAEHIDPARFEGLIGELILREEGVHWIRQVGATSEPDGGRDFIADWTVPPVGLSTVGVVDGGVPLHVRRHIAVQVKLRTRGVSRSDLSGIRDTIEHYECSGMLVVAFPNVTTQLLDHLSQLRRRGIFWIDWWGRPEIDGRLRRYPELAARYRDLVSLNPSA